MRPESLRASRPALQVMLNPGHSRMRWSEVLPCKAEFDVYATPEFVTQDEHDGPPASPRRRHACSPAGSAHAPSKLLAYGVHMRIEMKKLYNDRNPTTGSTARERIKI